MNKELIDWYWCNYMEKGCYNIKDERRMKISGHYFSLERKRNSPPMEPKRVMYKVRVWNGTPTQKYCFKK